MNMLGGVSAGRPVVVMAGSDGEPLRFESVLRPSSVMNGRMKNLLIAPVRVDVDGDGEEELVMVAAAEWRVELS